MEKNRIMVIDDDEEFIGIVKTILERTGKYDVMVFNKAKDFLNKAHEINPDLVIVDMLMPEIGGLEVCQMLNSDQAGKATPVIVISALYKDSDKVMAFKAGVVDYLVKPIAREDLVHCVEKALRFKKDNN